MKPKVSVVIRTLNEQRYLPELLQGISNQDESEFQIETVIVDSGSVDETLYIAQSFECRITHISKDDFTFGRSLNRGCQFADGDYLVFVSGHCIPVGEYWIRNLVRPLHKGYCDYTYGRQIARDSTKFSEQQLFDKYFPSTSAVPQEGFFCNNANAAIRRSVWERFKFNESITGCEDMYLAKQLVQEGGKVGYCADAGVYHIHDESWRRVRIRYEREAIALQKILPEVHINFFDMLNFITVGIAKDYKAAWRKRSLLKNGWSILMFRLMQYYGAYRGNHNHRRMSQKMKMHYFYPRVVRGSRNMGVVVSEKSQEEEV